MADLGGGEQQWTTKDNNGQQWTTKDNNGQQWTTMDNKGQQWTTLAVLHASLMPFSSIRIVNPFASSLIQHCDL